MLYFTQVRAEDQRHHTLCDRRVEVLRSVAEEDWTELVRVASQNDFGRLVRHRRQRHEKVVHCRRRRLVDEDMGENPARHADGVKVERAVDRRDDDAVRRGLLPRRQLKTSAVEKGERPHSWRYLVFCVAVGVETEDPRRHQSSLGELVDCSQTVKQ